MSDTVYQNGGLNFNAPEENSNCYAQAVKADGYVRRVSATLTRPGDTTQYAAGDQVSNSTSAPTALAFAVGRYAGGGGLITDAVCIDSFNQSVKPNLRVYLFDGETAPTANNDNSPWLPSDADLANSFGMIEFSSWDIGGTAVGTNGNCISHVRGLNIPFQCGAATQNIWGLAVERSTYTPGSAEYFKIRLGVI